MQFSLYNKNFFIEITHAYLFISGINNIILQVPLMVSPTRYTQQAPVDDSVPDEAESSDAVTSFEGFNLSNARIQDEPLAFQNIRLDRSQALAEAEKQRIEVKEKLLAENNQRKSEINTKFGHDAALAHSMIEQSRQKALFSLDEQHRCRVFEIEQHGLQQRLRIETSVGKLLTEAYQQRLTQDLAHKMGTLNTLNTSIVGDSINQAHKTASKHKWSMFGSQKHHVNVDAFH